MGERTFKPLWEKENPKLVGSDIRTHKRKVLCLNNTQWWQKEEKS